MFFRDLVLSGKYYIPNVREHCKYACVNNVFLKNMSTSSFHVMLTKHMYTNKTNMCISMQKNDQLCNIKNDMNNMLKLHHRHYSPLGTRARLSEARQDPPDKDNQLDHLMHRLSAENDMLSRCRNTYIMTLVSIGAMQLKMSPLPATIGAVVIVTAELNLALATLLYTVHLIGNWRNGKMTGLMFSGGMLFAIVHYILWSIVLTLLFPDGAKIDTELRHYTGEDLMD